LTNAVEPACSKCLSPVSASVAFRARNLERDNRVSPSNPLLWR
jgi:hypothetical protein